MRMAGVTRSTMVAGITGPLTRPPGPPRPPPPAAGAARARPRADERAQDDVLARIAGRQRLGLGRELVEEGIGDLLVDDDALGRHADLALVGEGAERRGLHRLV